MGFRLVFSSFFSLFANTKGVQHTPWIRVPRQEAGILLGAQAGRHGRPEAPKEDPFGTLLISGAAESAPPCSTPTRQRRISFGARGSGWRQSEGGRGRSDFGAGKLAIWVSVAVSGGWLVVVEGMMWQFRRMKRRGHTLHGSHCAPRTFAVVCFGVERPPPPLFLRVGSCHLRDLN